MNTGNSFHDISVDLLNNIVNRKARITDIDIEEIIDEVIAIYSPLIAANSIVVKKNIGRKHKIRTNEIILKQALISLFARSIYLLAENSCIYISTRKTMISNNLCIEISDDGFGFDENRFYRFISEGKKDLIPGLINIQLELNMIRKLAKELLEGNLNTNNRRKLVLSIPFQLTKYENNGNSGSKDSNIDKYYNVIAFPNSPEV